LANYDRHVKHFSELCVSRGASLLNEPTIVDYLCSLADRSERPRSQLKCVVAALTHLFDGLDGVNPMHNSYVDTFVTALVKSSTSQVRRRSKFIPVESLRQLILDWKNNDLLNIKDLRAKCLALLALTLMLRPTDVAPKYVTFCPGILTTESMVVGRSNVSFSEDGSATIHMHGIKDDVDRSGFEVHLPSASVPKLCPVHTL
jgi:hypothetical protein